MIKLYHYSNKDFEGYIKTSFFGENSFTSYSKSLSEVKRSHFYLDRDNKEYFFNGSKFLYVAEIDQNLLYNLEIDNLKCIRNFDSVTEFFSFLKNKGYKGFTEYNGRQWVTVLFNPIKIKDKIKLDKSQDICYNLITKTKRVADYPLKSAREKSEV
jgi:hypothetical protein